MNRLITLIISLALCAPLATSSLAQNKATQKKAATKQTSKKTTTTQKAKASSTKKATATKAAASKKTASTKGKTTASKQTKQPNDTKAISGLRSQREQIKRDIQKQERALQANKAQVKQKLRDLERISVDMNRRQKSIDSINTDINRINSNIAILQTQMRTLDTELEERKQAYVKSMRYMASHSNIQEQLMFIFSAKSFTETFRRMRFVRQYAAYQRTQGKALLEKQQQVTAKQQQLTATRQEKNDMLYKGRKAKEALAVEKDEQQKLVNSLQKQQKTIQTVLADQKKRDQQLNAEIDRLVAIEVEKARQRAIAEAKRKAEQAEAARKRAAELKRKREEAEARERENQRRIAEAKKAEERAKAAAAAARSNKADKERAEQLAREAEAARVAAERKAELDRERGRKAVAEAKRESDIAANLSSADRAVSSSFEGMKGRLPSPLPGGRVVSHYGQHGVEGLPGVVLDNKGINLLGSRGAAACAIYEGEVSQVFNIGGSWGVLVRHGAYISVYCNLSSVSVSRGQKVSARQALGTVGRDNILQFQLRKERAKLNPEAWIR